MPKKSKKLTDIAEIGEFGLIELLTKEFISKNDSTQLSVGDDAAVIDFNKKNTLISTDMLVEGVHFDLSYFTLKHLGYKAITSSISDICAMNGICSQVTVSVAISNRFKIESLKDLYSGIKVACENYNVDLVGGDTTSSNKGLIISVTALGVPSESGFVKRSGAKTIDLIGPPFFLFRDLEAKNNPNRAQKTHTAVRIVVAATLNPNISPPYGSSKISCIERPKVPKNTTNSKPRPP